MKHQGNYAEAFADLLLAAGGELLLAWLNVPYYVYGLFIVFCILVILAARILYWHRRRWS